ncbi:MAG TPA: hypothetical protein VFP72_10770 [Kineosporiaceae bacterium]|nr:hypothetical protein [Kineosporiaceae bacterium]
MKFLFGLLVVLFMLRLVIGAVRGRIRVRSCCPADPRQDLRMRGAYPPADRPGPEGRG